MKTKSLLACLCRGAFAVFCAGVALGCAAQSNLDPVGGKPPVFSAVQPEPMVWDNPAPVAVAPAAEMVPVATPTPAALPAEAHVARTASAPVTAARATQPHPEFVLRTGQPIHTELRSWADRDGWMLLWYPNVSWKTVREASIDKADVVAAVTEVIDILRDEGKAVTLRVSEGNKVMEVISTEVRDGAR